MPIDPDIPPILDALEQRIQAQIDQLRNTDSEVARHLSNTGDMLNAHHAELVAIKRRLDALEQTTPPPPPPTKARFAGDPGPGLMRWGCTYGSNSDPTARHETPTGEVLGVRRTFVSEWSNRNTMLTYARADHAKGRLPWVSTKIDPKNVNGAEVDKLCADLAALDGPVLLGVYHEPEDNIANGQFTAAQFRASQVRVREGLDKAGADNVCFCTPLMSYTWKPGVGRKPDDYYPGAGVWDALGVDAYSKDPKWPIVPEMDEWKQLKAWADAKGLPVVVGEFGQRGTAAVDAARMRQAYEAFIAQGVSVVAWFDTALNGGYPLEGAMLPEFHALLKDPRSVNLKEKP